MTYEEAEATIRWVQFKYHPNLSVFECELITSGGYIARGVVQRSELLDHKEVSKLRAVAAILEIENNRGN